MPVAPERLTIEAIEAAIGLPATQWHGRCYELAWLVADEHKLIKGHAVYGAWIGRVSKRGYWKLRAHFAFIRHGWVLLPGGHILDPTRWSFENKKPYVWLGENDGSYDPCNDHARQAQYANKECPAEYDHKQFFELPLSHGARLFLFKYSDEVLPRPLKKEPLCLNFSQLMWVANMPMVDLRPYTAEVYQAIIDAGQQATIPYDNREMILGQVPR